MPWTMIAASIGAQLFNSWQANKKTEELQARQREFQKAAQRKEFDRMRQLQREAAQLALEIEADVHKQRLEDIEANYDDVVKQYSTEIAIKKWPLKVLPFVMRGESFGTFFNGSKSIALHTILTPSNCDRFNEAVYMDIDLQLEAACNEHWNAQTSHPIAYYGGAWRKPTLDLDHIDLLKTQLKNVPTVVITPYFGPQLYFKVKMWGMGKDTEVKIELPKNLFSYEYEKGMNYSPKDESPKGDLIDTTIEEFVPYLECLIGYIADTYFWEMYKLIPRLPQIMVRCSNEWNKRIISTYESLYGDNIQRMIMEIGSTTDNVFNSENVKRIIKYVNGISLSELSTQVYARQLNDAFNKYVTTDVVTNCEVLNAQMLQEYNSTINYRNANLSTFIRQQTEITEIEYEILKVDNTDFSNIQKIVRQRFDNTNNCTHFYLCVWNNQIVIGRFGLNNFKQSIYLKGKTQRYFIFLSDNVIDVSQGNTQYYKIEISTNKLVKMEKKNFEERFGDEFAKIGKSIGRIVDSVGVEKKQKNSNSSVWDGEQSTTNNAYAVKLVNYFTQRVNEGTVEAVVENNLTMQTFLDWIDVHYSPFATKAYIVKGYVKDKKKYLYCIFLASDETAYIGPSDSAKCFIANDVNTEMAQIFANNDVCEIPFK